MQATAAAGDGAAIMLPRISVEASAVPSSSDLRSELLSRGDEAAA
jgi:hypothetical protein